MKVEIKQGALSVDGKVKCCPFATRLMKPEIQLGQMKGMSMEIPTCGTWCPFFILDKDQSFLRLMCAHEIVSFEISNDGKVN